MSNDCPDDDCPGTLAYSHQSPRPSGYAIVYACDTCDATERHEAGPDDLRRSGHR